MMVKIHYQNGGGEQGVSKTRRKLGSGSVELTPRWMWGWDLCSSPTEIYQVGFLTFWLLLLFWYRPWWDIAVSFHHGGFYTEQPTNVDAIDTHSKVRCQVSSWPCNAHIQQSAINFKSKWGQAMNHFGCTCKKVQVMFFFFVEQLWVLN